MLLRAVVLEHRQLQCWQQNAKSVSLDACCFCSHAHKAVVLHTPMDCACERFFEGGRETKMALTGSLC